MTPPDEIDSVEELRKLKADARRLPQIEEVWQHYKGNRYKIVAVAMQERDHKLVVVYRSLKDGIAWVRPADEFMGDVGNFDGNLYGTKQYRFEKVTE